MSYELYYNRAFIKVDDKFIPVIQSGSNNTWEYSLYAGRDVPEKIWYVANYKKRDKVLFTKEEIKELSSIYEDTSDNFKTRNTPFKPGEFGKWYLNGINNAKTAEEYYKYGNRIEFTQRIPDTDGSIHYDRTYVTTTEELINKINELQGKNFNIGFERRDLIFPKVKKKKKEFTEVDSYFVLYSTKYDYLYKLTSRKIWYTPYSNSAKKFKTEKEALNYIKKHDILKDKGYEPEFVRSRAYI